MTTQQTIYELLKSKGDCWHEKLDPGDYRPEEFHCTCGERYLHLLGLKSHIKSNNIDLTTPDGVMWMLVRLPKWDRFGEFNETLTLDIIDLGNDDDNLKCMQIMKEIIIWLATDAKDGKAPALFNALCEFTEVGG